MDVQFTKGPWSYTVPAGEEYAPFVLTSDGGDPLDAGTLVGGNAEAIANAALIASAPDLLAALEEWLTVGNDMKARRAVREKARAAIAKARLSQPPEHG